MAAIDLDRGLYCHFKFGHAGLEAMGLWLACKCYCKDKMTDGLIRRDVAEAFAGGPKRLEKLAHRLVTCGLPGGAGLWEPREDGWQMHDYADWCELTADTERKHRARSAAGCIGGRRSGVARRSKREAAASAALGAHEASAFNQMGSAREALASHL